MQMFVLEKKDETIANTRKTVTSATKEVPNVPYSFRKSRYFFKDQIYWVGKKNSADTHTLLILYIK